jgi:RNA polymerase sigma-70 factor, ECF subfamily
MSIELPAEHLLTRVAQQDVAALSELYDRYSPRIYGLMTRILPSREEAEDVLRDVFTRLWRESSTLSQQGGSVVAWLVMTARALAVDRLHPRKKSPAPVLQAAGGNNAKEIDASSRKSTVSRASAPKLTDGKPKLQSTNSHRPLDAMASPSAWLPQPREISLIDDRLALLYKVIDQLPKPQRQALELAVFSGLSEADIATEMGEPLGKVQRSLRAAVTFVKHRRRAVCGTWAANI